MVQFKNKPRDNSYMVSIPSYVSTCGNTERVVFFHLKLTLVPFSGEFERLFHLDEYILFKGMYTGYIQIDDFLLNSY